MGILIKEVDVLTQNRNRDVLRGVDILIQGKRIEKIGRNIKGKTEFKIDGRGKLAVPGLINTHTHVAMTLFRGYADDMRFWEAWPERIWPREKKVKAEDVRAGSLLGCLEMIRSGTTCFMDNYFFMDEVAEAVKGVGMRANLAYGMIDIGDAEKRKKELKIGEEFVKDFDGKADGRIGCSFAPHAPYSCSEELLLKAKELAEKHDALLQIHVAETRKEVFDSLKKSGKRPVEYLESIGFLSKRVIAAHCVWITKREVGMLGSKGAKVSYNPVSNMKLASGGVAPIPQMLESDVCVTFGTDGAVSNNSLNMLETIKVGTLLQKSHLWDSRVLNAQQALDFATINGAKALGIEAGSVEEGKLADMFLMELNSPNLLPANSLVSNLVYSSNPSNISDVIVDGKLVMKDRKILTIDEEKVFEKIRKVSEKFRE
ncbi:MAG: 5-methylthioadenosine/S-adenosylhomocysteine deaminase [Candidatus Fermentimicrarchaeum limneticum]|uniref:5-methylthioadenosine/S-adenosylhomocysteine deaminase n=1 Tax=Fermentimicrarchaeum limneticum TaxID=2795018 RepID=A0A7D5XIT1_FERL1|nr:MAG: 5-methylthioadenosine/S-adenosylhomocysteine deaminase [Candidatus Fermentimicrarchaeum limneticum]